MAQAASIIVTIAVVVAFAVWPGTVPGWALVAFACLLCLAVIPLTMKRVRTERRLMRSIWNVFAGK